MKKFWMMLLLCVFFAGCTVLPAEKNSVPADSTDEIRVFELGGRIVDAVVKGNFREFTANSGDAVSIKDQKAFDSSREEMEKRMGDFKSWRLLGTLQTPLLVNQIYAIKFRRKGSYGKDIEHEQLFQLIFGRHENDYKLIGMRFI